MKSRLQILCSYALFWLCFFECGRILFIAYNHSLASSLSWATIAKTFLFGFAHDISLTGYLVEAASLALILSFFIKDNKIIRRIFDAITFVCLVPCVIISVVDAELYRNWGYRMDCSVLQYLSTPKEAMASTPLWLVVLLSLLAIAFFVLFWLAYKRFVSKRIDSIGHAGKKWGIWGFVLIMGCFIVPIRGGVGVAALRTGTVYFCTQSFANHAAINDQWHFLYSFRYAKKEVANVFMEDAECEALCDSLLASENGKPVRLIARNRPNILLFILESFTAEQIGVLGGEEGVTPNLDSIARSGILFANCYGNGTKSEMGIVSILSGYPAQPTTAIIKHTEKMEKLPHLSRVFDSLGYNLALYHGGDLRFANLNSYFRNGGFEKCVSVVDFEEKDRNSKWGAYDHVVFNRMFADLHSMQEPFFTVCYTLSSHEPFDVPMKSQWYGSTEYDKFLNSIHYADSCIGDFMRRARNEDWWKNTVVVFVSDHGARINREAKIVSSREKFHIPMIWSGGAIKESVRIDSLLCQCDFPMMLCNQLGLPSEQFSFSKDILRGDRSWAFYTYNNGFGFLRGDQFVSWDNDNGKIISKTDNLQDSTLRQGQAFLQKVTTDFCEK